MATRVSRRIRTVLQVAPVSPASGGTPRRPTGTSRSFAELLAEAEKVGGLIASRHARPVSSTVHSAPPPGTPPGDWGMLARVPPLQEMAPRGLIAQGMALELLDREEEKSRPGEEPES